MADWGSGGGESSVSNRHEGRVSDRPDGRMSKKGDSRLHRRSECGSQKDSVPDVWRMERIISWSPIVKWSSEAK